MKKLFLSILILAFSFGNAHASNKALCMDNKAGGRIILTSIKADGYNVAFSTSDDGISIQGAWVLLGERTILILWTSFDQTSLFDASMFKQCTL